VARISDRWIYDLLIDVSCSDGYGWSR